MIRYLKECYCNGLPPACISLSGMYERNALVSRMMLERERIRLLRAPSLMGKTSLVCQYARLAFSFDKVLWLDATHPCLLKGLHNSCLLEGIENVVCEGGLVVFEDVPCLSDTTRECFVKTCSKLLERKVEVIVTCHPAADPFADCGSDVLVIDPEELLYSDSELEDLRRRGYLPMGFRGATCRAERVPGLMNRSTDAMERFLMAQQREACSSFQQLLTYALLLISMGSLADLSLVMGRRVSIDELGASRLRPYVELSDFGEEYSAEGFPLGDVLRVLRSQLRRICENSQDMTPERFVTNLADLLLTRRSVDTATRLMVEACGPEAREQWAERHLPSMVEMSAPLHASILCKSLEGQGRVLPARLRMWSAVANLLFSEADRAAEELGIVASDANNDIALRVEAATYAAIASANHPSELDFGADFGSVCLELRKRGGKADSMQVLWNDILDGDSGIEGLIESAQAGRHSPDWLLAAACCLHGIAVERARGEKRLEDERILPHLLDCVGLVIERCVADERSETRMYLLKHELDSLASGPYLSRAAVSFLEQIEARIRAQRASFGRLPASSARDCAGFARPLGEALHFRMSASSVMSVPLLEVKMFGRFEACIGGQPVDHSFFTRMKTRSLLALLALDAGKDVSCERLAALLWPESMGGRARHNFDSIFSILKRALMLQDGSCPYLRRAQGVCRLAAPFVRSDADELQEACQQLRYGSLCEEDSMVLLERVKGIYQGEFVPGDHAVPSIESARSLWKGKVVDALLAAASNAYERGFASEALDFAQYALKCDCQREDAYEAVMLLHYARKQRNGAIEAFFEYRRMSRELGLDPSARMSALYESIIADEGLPWEMRWGFE